MQSDAFILTEIDSQPRILYTVKLLLKTEGSINMFSDIQDLKNLTFSCEGFLHEGEQRLGLLVKGIQYTSSDESSSEGSRRDFLWRKKQK